MARRARYGLPFGIGLVLIALAIVRVTSTAPAPGPEALTPIPTLAPAIPTPTPSLQRSLAPMLESQLLGYPGTVGLAITDLQTEETLAINGQRRISAASTIKIFILLATLREVETGAYPLEEVQDALDAMMSWSDNQAAATLTERVGFEKINQLMKSLGMEQSVFHFWPGIDQEWGSYDDNYLTASEVNQALVKLHRGQVLSPTYTRLALNKMQQSISEHNIIIPGRLPEGIRVAHKMGWLYWDPELQIEIANDAGIVFLGDDDTPAFAISFLSQDNPDHDQAIALGASLSRLAYNYFVSRYGK